MNKEDKKKIGIGVAIIASIVILFFVGKWFIARPSGEQTTTAKNDETKVELAQASVHALCRYADSVGIDTARYSVKPTSLAADIDDKRAGLLMEIRYGKKPSRLSFSGLKEKVDSAWVPKVDAANVVESVAKLTTFGPYNQLVGHYNRIRRGGRSNSLTADSLRLIRQTLNFYRYTNRFDADQFVVVNIPAAELNVFDRKGTRLLPMDVIVGKPDRQSPCMTTYEIGRAHV